MYTVYCRNVDLNIYKYTYIYIYVCVCACVYIYKIMYLLWASVFGASGWQEGFARQLEHTAGVDNRSLGFSV